MRVARIAAVGAVMAAGIMARLLTEDVPTTVPTRGNSLGAMACPSQGWCVAVGSMGSAYGVQVPFAVLSADDGRTAQPPQAPAPIGDSVLSAVACLSPDSCIAVGSHEQPTPYFGARSAGVRPLTVEWDGTTWHSRPGAIPRRARDAGLNGVACASSMCMAVGEYRGRFKGDRPLAESWDGKAWTLRLPRKMRIGEEVEDVVLDDVACVSATSCTAVGHFSYEMTFLGEAVAPLIERWNGTAWRPERAANPQTFGDTKLKAVACPSPGRCVAVGFQQRPNRMVSTFAEIRDGNVWKVLPMRDPPGSPGAELSDVACPLPDRCIAVGSSVSRTGLMSLVESWDGKRWTIEPTPTPAGSRSSTLTAIDCARHTECYAAGVYWQRSPIGRAFLAKWNGTGWTILPAPGPLQGPARP